MNLSMNRRDLLATGKKAFLLALAGKATVGCASPSYESLKSRKINTPGDTRDVFMELGTCSRMSFFILNREFGHLKDTHELAADPLAGGVMKMGHQCGMLWGASLAVGAESYRRCGDYNQAIRTAISATGNLAASFQKRASTMNCRDITETDFNSTFGLAKYLITGRFLDCFDLAEQWVPEAIHAAHEGLSQDKNQSSAKATSCASEIARKMGASEEETVMVAGFAGGLGLSGGGCGALSAAIWMNTFSWCSENKDACNVKTGESPFENPKATRTLEAFDAVTGSEILCRKICGNHFDSIEAHDEYIKNGGCRQLINALANS